ncbi:MAG: OmpA family protein [Alphaproteobacteria bacterium]
MLLALAACGGTQYGGGPLTAEGDIRAAERGTATSPFNENLRKGYLELANNGRRQVDWIDAGIFARKALLAAEGQDVQPVIPAEWGENPSLGGSTPETRAELEAARAEMMGLLNANARSSNPTQAARAQVMFDCWVEKAESVYWLVDDCKAKFYEAMNALRGRPAAAPAAPAAPPARDYLVFFDFDRSNIRPDAADVLRRVTQAYQSLNANRVDLIGHTDRAGSAEYNQRLSERRATSVRDFLSRQGIPAANITATGRGESDPRVPTPDGVREQENRRVEIRLQ